MVRWFEALLGNENIAEAAKTHEAMLGNKSVILMPPEEIVEDGEVIEQQVIVNFDSEQVIFVQSEESLIHEHRPSSELYTDIEVVGNNQKTIFVKNIKDENVHAEEVVEFIA